MSMRFVLHRCLHLRRSVLKRLLAARRAAHRPNDDFVISAIKTDGPRLPLAALPWKGCLGQGSVRKVCSLLSVPWCLICFLDRCLGFVVVVLFGTCVP